MARRAIPAVLIALSLLDVATARADVLFDSSRSYSVASAMGAIVAAGDVNDDGELDLVSVARYAENAPVSVLLGRGDGTFERTTTVSSGGLSLAGGDLDGDGNLDLAVPGFSSIASILFGNGDGTFDPPVGVGTYGGGAPGGIMSIAIAQLGGADPGLDIAVTNSNGLQVLLGKGDGTFAAPATYPGWDASELVTGDFTEDGREDIGLTRIIGSDTKWIAVLPGSAAGALGTAITTTIDLALGSPVVTDDDGDGLLDIVGIDSSMGSSTVTLYYGAGDGTFESPQRADFGSQPSRIGIGDFDEDAKPDIAANTYDQSLVVWLATGFFAQSEYSQVSADGPLGMAVIDANNDGADDVATATWSGKVIVSLNAPGVHAAPGNLSFAPHAVGTTAGPQTITVTNTGTPDLRISGVSVEGAAASDFTAGGSCQGATLTAGAACHIAAAFTPGTAGARAATLMITGNQAASPTRLPLAGTGIATSLSGTGSGHATPDTTAPALSLKLRRERLGRVIRRGLRISITCSETCNFKASARIASRTARRLDLSRSRKPFVVGRSRGAVPAGRPTTLRMRLSSNAARALRKQRAIMLTVVVTALDAAGNKASTKHKLRLHR